MRDKFSKKKGNKKKNIFKRCLRRMNPTREGKKLKRKIKDFKISKLKKSTLECLKSRNKIDN
jgi:hypothetical protein